MKRARTFLIAMLVGLPQAAGAQLLSSIGSGFDYYWGEAKTGLIKGTIGSWDSVMGNSCGDVTLKTARALQPAPSCQMKAGDVDDFVETAFFNAGAKIEIRDEQCQIKRYQAISGPGLSSRAAVTAFGDDLRTKLPDLRKRYKEIQDLSRKMANDPAAVLIRRGDGPVAPQNIQFYLDKTRAGWDLLYKKQIEFNQLVFSSPLAHFPEGQNLLYRIATSSNALTDDMVRDAYKQAAVDIKNQMTRLQKAQVPGHPGTFDLSRTNKIFLLKQGNPASWFKTDRESEAEATKMMCNMNRVYKYGESVTDGAITLGTYALGLEGYLVKVAFAAKFASMAARARSGLVSLETMNMLSWGAWSVGAIDGAVKACGLPTLHVGRSDNSCHLDPQDEVMTMEKNNCVLGLAMASGALAFTFKATKLGQQALSAAKAEVLARTPSQVVTPLRTLKNEVVNQVRRPK